MTVRLYTGTIGYRIEIEAEQDDGEPYDLTDCTVSIKLYEMGSKNLKWTKEATISDASNGTAYYDTVSTDFDTEGYYYTEYILDYDDGNYITLQGKTYEIVETELNLVTPDELLDFLNIPKSEGFKESTIKSYLEEAEDTLDLLTTSTSNTTNVDYIEIKRAIIKRKAAITYFMNMGESNINPELRIQKIKMWKDDVSGMIDRFNSMLSSDGDNSAAIARRVKHSDYENENSYLYGKD